MKFCTAMSAALALPVTFAPKIAQALDEVQRPTLVWLEFQDCAGNTEALLRAANPTVAELVLDILSVDYHETIMAAAGHQAEEALAKVVKEQKGKYIAVVEGSIPLKDGGYLLLRRRQDRGRYRPGSLRQCLRHHYRRLPAQRSAAFPRQLPILPERSGSRMRSPAPR